LGEGGMGTVYLTEQFDAASGDLLADQADTGMAD
jgi:hypothetical protein